MIGRYIFIKLKAPFSNATGRQSLSEKCLQFFAENRFVQKAEIGMPSDADSTKAWDLSIALYFIDRQKIDSFLAAPDVDAFDRSELQPNAVVTKAWNFSISDGGHPYKSDPAQK